MMSMATSAPLPPRLGPVPNKRASFGFFRLFLGAAVLALSVGLYALKTQEHRPRAQQILPGTAPRLRGFVAGDLTYTNERFASVPWSIHVVRWPREDPAFQVHSKHARDAAVGLATLSAQVGALDPALGTPLAAVNGDFYQRDDSFAGDPRGLQIVEGEVISAPVGGASFWVDSDGQPHATNVISRFTVTWPDETTERFGLNEERDSDVPVLFTPAAGTSTRTRRGVEFVLDPSGDGPWLPLHVGRTYSARVREVRDTGNTRLDAGLLVLSVGSRGSGGARSVTEGSVLKLQLATAPDLTGAVAAISGGPVIVQGGRPRTDWSHKAGGYAYSSRYERHPRSAVGWSRDHFVLIEVDGRQPGLSVGMTLEELGQYMVDLGCEGAMNLDGGGSATMWVDGRIRNSPCEGGERRIANSLIVARRTVPKLARGATSSSPAD